MTTEFTMLRYEVERTKLAAARALDALTSRVHSCAHDWGNPTYNPIVTEAYTDPGDPPGTMGIDWRGPCYVPSTKRDRWTRQCSICGHIQETTNSTNRVTAIPKF